MKTKKANSVGPENCMNFGIGVDDGDDNGPPEIAIPGFFTLNES